MTPDEIRAMLEDTLRPYLEKPPSFGDEAEAVAAQLRREIVPGEAVAPCPRCGHVHRVTEVHVDDPAAWTDMDLELRTVRARVTVRLILCPEYPPISFVTV